jgi:hypothetical protein
MVGGAPLMSEQRLLASIPKNGRGDEIRIMRGDFKGLDVITARIWYPDRKTGEMRPGRDGIAFRTALLDAVISALQSAKDGGDK